MDQEYNQNIALHYAAYRPSLHPVILKKCIESRNFLSGLDIGCGTGQSSIALAAFCKEVVGIEPSDEMLAKSLKHPQIEYLKYGGSNLEFSDKRFDIITFAGSLFYAKSQNLLHEVIRIATKNATIIVYDFEVSLESTLSLFNIKSLKSISNYNHREDFSGMSAEHLSVEKTGMEDLSFPINTSELSHLLLSSIDNYHALSNKIGGEQLFDGVRNYLTHRTTSENHQIASTIYFTVYNVKA